MLLALAGILFAIFLGALILLLRGYGGQDRLRIRVREASGIDTGPKEDTGPNIRIATSDERPVLQRLGSLLGYNTDLPPGFSASVPVVAAVAVTAGAVVFWRVSSTFGVFVGVAGAFLTAAALARFLFRRKTKAYRDALFNQIPDAISLVLRAVRAGLPVGEALRNVGREVPSPSKEEFTRLAGEMALGIPVDTAIWNLYSRTELREYAFFAVTLGLQGQTGGNLGETLENLADMVRRRVSMAAKARALAAEARTSAGILAVLPFLTVAAILVVNPGYVSLLFTDKRGPAFLLAFAVLLTCGMLVIRWLIQRATQD